MEGTAHLSKGPATAAEGAGLSSSVVWISPGAVGPRPVSLAEEEGKATELRAQPNKNVLKKKKALPAGFSSLRYFCGSSAARAGCSSPGSSAAGGPWKDKEVALKQLWRPQGPQPAVTLFPKAHRASPEAKAYQSLHSTSQSLKDTKTLQLWFPTPGLGTPRYQEANPRTPRTLWGCSPWRKGTEKGQKRDSAFLLPPVTCCSWAPSPCPGPAWSGGRRGSSTTPAALCAWCP